jgi:glucoamylase
MAQSATALLAARHTGSALRALTWLATMQDSDGGMPQNSWINGAAHWKGRQLDEVAAPILLAWQLRRARALQLFQPWAVVSRAAGYLIAHGPVTNQERWEESAGYSPSTLAAIIASLVCAADFARDRSDENAATFILDYADWLSSHLEDWTVTERGELLEGKPRHFIRITPADLSRPDVIPDPDTAILQIANRSGSYPARNVVSPDFLQLVRLGVRDPHDPLIVDSLAVVDAVLKHDLPQGPCWRRYNHDGYGQKADGGAYDGTGVGRCWPLLTGERGHYELAAGRDPMPFIRAIEGFANQGGMISEQVWDSDDLPSGRMKRGGPTGAAMPLCWAHAEYLVLLRSRQKGECFERIEPTYERYVKNKTASRLEIWTFAYQCRTIRAGRDLRIIMYARATVRWSFDNWQTAQDTGAIDAGIGCWFVDLPAAEREPGTEIDLTFRWIDRWEERNFRIIIVEE